jgi:lysophospholipase L1-like esterase
VSFPWKIVAAGGLALGALGVVALGVKTLEEKRRPPVPKRIALIGDSYAVGLGPELAKIYPEFKYEGHVGTTTWQWANHDAACAVCGDWLTAFKPNVVLIALGVNDGTAPNSGHYQTLVRGIQGIGARAVWIEPPAVVKAPAARKAIAALGVPTVPATNIPLAADGLHPTGSGYRAWAQEIASEVLRA